MKALGLLAFLSVRCLIPDGRCGAAPITVGRDWQSTYHAGVGVSRLVNAEAEEAGFGLGAGFLRQFARPNRAFGGDIHYVRLGEAKGSLYDSYTGRTNRGTVRYAVVPITAHVDALFPFGRGADAYAGIGGGVYSLSAKRVYRRGEAGIAGVAKANDSAKLGLLAGLGVVYHAWGSAAAGVDARGHLVLGEDDLWFVTIMARLWF